MLIAGDLQHVGDRRDGSRGPDAESRGGKADAKTAMVGEPFQRVANGATVDDASANPAHSVPEIEAVDGFSAARADPAQGNHNRAHTQHESGADSIDEVSLERDEPGFEQDE